jgi:hypothetical protein
MNESHRQTIHTTSQGLLPLGSVYHIFLAWFGKFTKNISQGCTLWAAVQLTSLWSCVSLEKLLIHGPPIFPTSFGTQNLIALSQDLATGLCVKPDQCNYHPSIFFFHFTIILWSAFKYMCVHVIFSWLHLFVSSFSKCLCDTLHEGSGIICSIVRSPVVSMGIGKLYLLDMTLCDVEVHLHFRDVYCLHIQGCIALSLPA